MNTACASADGGLSIISRPGLSSEPIRRFLGNTIVEEGNKQLHIYEHVCTFGAQFTAA